VGFLEKELLAVNIILAYTIMRHGISEAVILSTALTVVLLMMMAKMKVWDKVVAKYACFLCVQIPL